MVASGFADMREADRGSTMNACCTLTANRPLALRLARLHLEANLAVLDDRLDVPFLALLLGQVKGTNQNCLVTARGIGALDRARPDPGDDGRLSPTLLFWNLNLGIQVADTTKRLIAHPIAVVSNIGGKARVALPARNRRLGTVLRVHRGIAREHGRNLDHGLVDGHRNGVQILRIRLEPQALGLERNRPATGKWIEQGKRLVTDRLLDLGLRGI